VRVVELTGPGDGRFARLVRTVAMSVAAQAGRDVELCDLVGFAVGQACECLASAGIGRLDIQLVDADDITVTIRGTSAASGLSSGLDEAAAALTAGGADKVVVMADDGTVVATWPAATL
jgi:hypothetical protein